MMELGTGLTTDVTSLTTLQYGILFFFSFFSFALFVQCFLSFPLVCLLRLA